MEIEGEQRQQRRTERQTDRQTQTETERDRDRERQRQRDLLASQEPAISKFLRGNPFVVFVVWFFNVPSTCKVCPRDESFQTILHAATLREKIQINCLIQSQHADTRSANPRFDPVTSDAWRGCQQSTITGVTRPEKPSPNPRLSRLASFH